METASTVSITTSYGSASAADVSVPATLTLPKDATSATLRIPITADAEIEGAETFTVELSAVADAPYDLGAQAAATVTVHDDPRATLTLSGAAYTVNEADGALEITVNIAPALETASSVAITTQHITSAAADVSVPATLTLPQGATSATLRVPVTADTNIDEGAETFKVTLSAVADAPYELGTPSAAVITIIDDDRPTVAFSQSAYTVNEAGGALEISVHISPPLASDSTVNITTSYGSASAADVIMPATLPLLPEGEIVLKAPLLRTTLTLPKGALGATLRIPITADTEIEGAETFTVGLSAVADASYRVGAPDTATITIRDDDRPTLTLSGAAYTVNEADGALDISVNIAPALPAASTVNITSQHITSAAADVSVPATLTLPKDATSATLRVPVTADAEIDEGAETFTVALSAVADAPYDLGTPSAAVITINDDPRPTLSFSQAAWSVTETDTDSTLNIPVKISPAMAVASTVAITTRYDSAAAGDVSVPATLTLPAGQTSVDLPIIIRGDEAIEGAESFEIELAAVAGAPYTLVWPAAATITIMDTALSLAAPVVGSNTAWTLTVTPGDQKLDVSWQAPPGVRVSDISKYRVSWCLEHVELGCSPTSREVDPSADGSGSYTIIRHFAPASGTIVPLINGARYRVYVRARRADYTSLARSEFSYNNRPQASGDNPEN